LVADVPLPGVKSPADKLAVTVFGVVNTSLELYVPEVWPS